MGMVNVTYVYLKHQRQYVGKMVSKKSPPEYIHTDYAQTATLPHMTNMADMKITKLTAQSLAVDTDTYWRASNFRPNKPGII